MVVPNIVQNVQREEEMDRFHVDSFKKRTKLDVRYSLFSKVNRDKDRAT